MRINDYGIDYLKSILIMLCICILGLLLSSGYLLKWFQSIFKTFLNIFDIHDDDNDANDNANDNANTSPTTSSQLLGRHSNETKPFSSQLNKNKIQKNESNSNSNSSNYLKSYHKVFIGNIENLIGLRCYIRDHILDEYDSAVVINVRKLERYQNNINSHHHYNSNKNNNIDQSDHLHNNHLNKIKYEEKNPFLRKHSQYYPYKNDRYYINQLHSQNKDLNQTSPYSSSLSLFGSGLQHDSSLIHDEKEEDDDEEEESHNRSGVQRKCQKPQNELLVYDVQFESNHKIETGIPACYVHIAGPPPFSTDDLNESELSSSHPENQNHKTTTATRSSSSSSSSSQFIKSLITSKKKKNEEGGFITIPRCPLGHPLEPLPSHFTRDGLDQRCFRCFRYFPATFSFHTCVPCEYVVCPKCATRCIPKKNSTST